MISLSFILFVRLAARSVLISKSFIGLLSIACKYNTLSTNCRLTTFFNLFFQNHVKPYSHRSAVAFHKRVRDVHFHIFGNYFFKSIFRHLLDFYRNLVQVQCVCESETAFCYVFLCGFFRQNHITRQTDTCVFNPLYFQRN